ncbi:ArsR/SmtB family transcription factor [Tsukamurella pseudospumae]|uniref:ArsR/SmtB family transcription factor n=1 Tax=Tsukamurella pseudospumae TaxID=239498 RepID=UPI0009E951E4|nr:metalloregulator ArsR/SmtB family transcription factor [Tsukamurella pseudospumae]
MGHSATDIYSGSTHHPERLSNEQVDAAVSMLAMLAEPTRLRLLWALRDDELGVGTLAEKAGCTPTAASQHLAKLRLAGVVVNRADGTARLYRLAGGHVLRLLLESVAQADHTVTGTPDHL